MKRLLFIICALLFVSAGAFAQASKHTTGMLENDQAWTAKNYFAFGQVGKDVRAFGAKCDYNEETKVGTDDTAAFQAAYNALPLKTGTHEVTTAENLPVRIGFLYFEGKCMISDTLTFGPNTGLIGHGWDSSKLFMKDGAFVPANMPVSTAGAISGSKVLQFPGAIPASFYHIGTVTVSGAGAAGATLTARVVLLDTFANQMTLDVAASTTAASATITGTEKFMLDVDPVMSGILGAGAVPTPASTFGTRFSGFKADCNGGAFSGTNSSCAAVRFYGAQGSLVSDLFIENFGMRGFNFAGGNATKFHGQLWVSGGVQGPGVVFETVNGIVADEVSCENVNPSATYTDANGDPVPCLYIHNGLLDKIDRLQLENNATGGKIGGLANSWTIETASMAPPSTGATSGIILQDSAIHTAVKRWVTFKSSPALFVNEIDDRVNNKQIPGNLVNNPSGSFIQDYEFENTVNLKSGQAAGDGSASKSSAILTFEGSGGDGVNPENINIQLKNEIGSGVNPTGLFRVIPQSGYAGTQQWLFDRLGVSTVSGNFNSLPMCFRASTFNVSEQLPVVCMQYLMGSGSAGSQLQTLAITQGATTGGTFNFRLPTVSGFLIGTDTAVYRLSAGEWVFGNGSTTANPSGILRLNKLRTGASGTTSYVELSGTPTASRTQTLQDVSGTVPVIIASGTSALGTSAIATGVCATVVTTAATNAATTDVISWSFNAAPGSGWPGLVVKEYVTSGNVNFLVCNPTAGSLTPAAATLNWRVIR